MVKRVAVAALVASVSCLAGACEGAGDFDGAPKARAPSEPLVNQKSSESPSGRGRSGGDMPAGHPPVRSGESRSGGGNARRGSRGGSPTNSRGGGANLPVDWTAPSNWRQVEPSSSMRKAQYEVPAAGDAEPATLAVFHFPGGAGGVSDNLDRWIDQFGGGEGSSGPEKETRTVNGLEVHILDISGTYTPGMSGGEPKDNYRLLGAIVETDAGSVFLKLVGPQPTVGRAKSDFEALVSSLEPRS